MTALIYLLRKSIKNKLREILRSPAKLILYLIVLVSIIGVILISILAPNEFEREELLPMYFLTGIFFAFLTLFFATNVSSGTSNGNAIFEMSDVNFLFVSPISQRKILLYGIVRLVKASLLAGIFILFQSATLMNFGVHADGMLLIFLSFALCTLSLVIASMFMYNFTNGNRIRKKAVKLIAFLLYVPLLIFFAVKFIGTGDLILAAEEAINSPLLSFIPFAGWTARGAIDIISGELISGLMFLSLNLACCILIMVYILRSNRDYYEDTLVATESLFERKRALSEGNINAGQEAKKSVAVTKTGISGIGASTLFGKHLRESFRDSRLGFLTKSSIILIIINVIVCAITKDIIISMGAVMGMNIMLIGTGRGLREIYTHYIFLIPESSLKKLIWSNIEVVVKTLIEGFVMFIIGGIIAKADVMVIIAAIIAFMMFSLPLLSLNYLSMRITTEKINSGLLIMFYYFGVIIIMVPGIIAAVLLGITITGTLGITVGLAVLAAWEIITGVVCFYLSRGVLDNCDMPVVKTLE